MYLREEMVKLANSWLGKKESDGSYKEIIDIYNSYKGNLPRGIKMDYKWPWCACTWSALAIKLGYTNIIPIEISCGLLIDEAKKMSCWEESDKQVPKPGDAVLYDWDDNGVGDNNAWPDHVGMVSYVNEQAGYFEVIEGNYSDSVKKRTVSINGKFIRGFIMPKYSEGENFKNVQEKQEGKPINEIAHEVIIGKWGNGDYRKNLLLTYGYKPEEVQAEVNRILNGSAVKPSSPVQPDNQEVKKEVKSTCYANHFSSMFYKGTYETTANLYLRNDAGTNKKALCLMPKGTKVHGYGFFSKSGNVVWPLVEVVLDGVKYTGFCCINYLK